MVLKFLSKSKSKKFGMPFCLSPHKSILCKAALCCSNSCKSAPLFPDLQYSHFPTLPLITAYIQTDWQHDWILFAVDLGVGQLRYMFRFKLSTVALTLRLIHSFRNQLVDNKHILASTTDKLLDVLMIVTSKVFI